MSYPTEIRHIDSMQITGLDHRGAYTNIGGTFQTLYDTLAAAGQAANIQVMCGIYYDDPDTVAEESLRSMAGAVLGNAADVSAPLSTATLSGGRHAVLRYTGPYTEIAPAWQWFYGSHLPEAGLEPSGEPCFELYLNSPHDTAPKDLITEICVPLKS